ncbi:RNA polymerase sigma factor FliA [Sporomusa rhizae]|uniref:sigma-70 family RNA polymerase sigma factor n=1 Tax=Sporomusa rhizae TaxID=357999 RepID=UPI003529FE4D
MASNAKLPICIEEDLFIEYEKIIHYAIKRYYPYRPNVEYEDLFQIASIALLTARRKYDPTRGASFVTYALLHMRSALYKEMRRNTARKRKGIVLSLFQNLGEGQARFIDIIPDPTTTEGYNLYSKRGMPMANTRSTTKKVPEAPTVTKLDLSSFIVFNANNAMVTRNSAYITVTKNGKITMSSEVGKKFKTGETLEILLNQAGNIIVVRSSTSGIRCRQNGKNSEGKIISCANAKLFMESKKMALPARFRAEWDEEILAWVGRQ